MSPTHSPPSSALLPHDGPSQTREPVGVAHTAFSQDTEQVEAEGKVWVWRSQRETASSGQLRMEKVIYACCMPPSPPWGLLDFGRKGLGSISILDSESPGSEF